MFEHLDDPHPPLPDDRLRAEVRRLGRRRRTHRRVARGLGGSTLALVVVLATVAWVGRRGAGIERFALAGVEQVDAGGRPAIRNPDRFDQPYTVLVVGSDARPGLDGDRTDTLLLLRVDGPAGRLRVVSLPRDLWVPIDGGAAERLNTAFARGPDVLVRTVNRVFGVTVDHYAQVGFDAFAALVDAAGGVPLVFTAPVHDEFSGLVIDTAGCHVLDGATALALTRSRHLQVRTPQGWREDPRSDLGRIARQQVVVRAAMRAAAQAAPSGETVAALARLARSRLVLDDGLGLDDLADLATWTRSLPPEAVVTASPPVRPFTTPAGADVLDLDGDRALVRRLLDGTTEPAPAPMARPDSAGVEDVVRVPRADEACP